MNSRIVLVPGVQPNFNPSVKLFQVPDNYYGLLYGNQPCQLTLCIILHLRTHNPKVAGSNPAPATNYGTIPKIRSQRNRRQDARF